MSTRKPYTPNDLRKLAKQSGPQWHGSVRAALAYAADVMEAADVVIKQSSTPQPEDAEIAALRKDAEMLDWLDQNIFSRENLQFNGKLHPELNMWVMFSPKGHQGSARNIIDAAMTKDAASPAA